LPLIARSMSNSASILRTPARASGKTNAGVLPCARRRCGLHSPALRISVEQRIRRIGESVFLALFGPPISLVIVHASSSSLALGRRRLAMSLGCRAGPALQCRLAEVGEAVYAVPAALEPTIHIAP